MPHMHIFKLIVLDFWRVVLIWKQRLFEKLYFINMCLGVILFVISFILYGTLWAS